MIVTDRYGGEHVPWVYFHGKIEQDVGYDLVSVIEDGSVDSFELLLGTEPSVIAFLSVRDRTPDGTDMDLPAIAFIWRAPLGHPMGLITYFHDTEYAMHAFEQMKELREHI